MTTIYSVNNGSDWLKNIPCCKGEVKITQVTGKKPVTEKSEQSRREYWSKFYQKKYHIADGCAHW